MAIILWHQEVCEIITWDEANDENENVHNMTAKQQVNFLSRRQ